MRHAKQFGGRNLFKLRVPCKRSPENELVERVGTTTGINISNSISSLYASNSQHPDEWAIFTFSQMKQGKTSMLSTVDSANISLLLKRKS